ncbi:MAG TPA: 50S ribosomal protein L13 [Dehalococcoidia bacterium]|nr:50S ribosomal protein L13 [Dehalococcoidia bacterium]
MKTYSTKAADIDRKWWVLDASDKTLGKLASEVAILLKGKHKPIYSPHIDVGDYVIVINAAKVNVTGKKLTQKMYYRHSQYPGGLKSTSLKRMMETHPTRVVEHAVKGMLPHNRLGAAMIKKLKVYPGADHPHEAQVKTVEKES